MEERDTYDQHTDRERCNHNHLATRQSTRHTNHGLQGREEFGKVIDSVLQLKKLLLVEGVDVAAVQQQLNGRTALF